MMLRARAVKPSYRDSLKLGRSYTLCVLLVALLAFAVAPVSTVGGAAPVKIRFWVWDVLADVSTAVLKKSFEAKYPDVEVDIVKMGIWDVHDKLSVALAAGTGAPDVSELTLRRFSDFKATGALVDVTDRVAVSSADFVDYLARNVQHNGRLMGLPISQGPGVVYYRKDIFDRFNIKAEDINTWDDFARAGRTITDERTGRYMTFVSSPAEQYSTDPWVLYLASMGGQIFGSDGKVVRNNTKAEAAFKWIYEMAHVHKIAKVEPFGRPAFWGLVRSDRIVTLPGTAPILGNLKSQLPEQEGKWRVMSWPMWPGARTRLSGDWGALIVVIPKQTRNLDAALKWAEFLAATRAGQEAVYRLGGIIPGYRPALASSAVVFPDPYLGGQVLMDAVKAQIMPAFHWFDWTEASTIIGAEIDAMMARQKAPEQAWKDAERLLIQSLKR